PAAIAVLQEDADRARLRRQGKRAGLYGLFRSHHRRLAEELDLVGADHAVGPERSDPKVRGFRRKVTGPAASLAPRLHPYLSRWRNPQTARAIRPSIPRKTRRGRRVPRRIGRIP